MKFLRADIPYLRELALNNNPLQKIEGHAFEMVSPTYHHHHQDNNHHENHHICCVNPHQHVQVPQIVSLDVSGCQIKKIAARAFQQVILVIIKCCIFFFSFFTSSSVISVIKVIITVSLLLYQ